MSNDANTVGPFEEKTYVGFIHTDTQMLDMLDGCGCTDGVDHPVVKVLQPGKIIGQENDTLPPRLDLRNHSPDGFSWGYGGSGPAQLALAILADAIGDERALAIYQDFKWKVVSRFDIASSWNLPLSKVMEVVNRLEADRKVEI